MPDKDSHLAVANRNRVLIDQLLAAGNQHAEWVAVIAFYRALHLVDAVLFVEHPARHGGSHEQRNQLLKTTRKYANLNKYYRPLFAASLVARYLKAEGQGYRTFEAYMSGDDVVNELLNHYLKQVEKSAEKIIGPLVSPSLAPDPAD